MLKSPQLLAHQLKIIHEKNPFSQIVDMGSGSGGAMPMVLDELNKNKSNSLSLLLTDLHPNPKKVKYYSENHDRIKYQAESFDASDLSNSPEGLKTMINSFHHMPPEKAKAILKSAQDNKESIFIYELAENKTPLILWWIMLPISFCIMIPMVWFMTLAVKNISLTQVFFTYVIPVIPLCYAWDGQASYPRTYTFEDINELIDGFKNEEYLWEVNPAEDARGRSRGYYVYGRPN